jgi:hypothetical protein
MKYLKIFFGAITLVLAITGAFFSNAATAPRKMTNKPYDMTLYRPFDCVGFGCGTSGTITCTGYYSHPTSGGTPCNSIYPNTLVHQ